MAQMMDNGGNQGCSLKKGRSRQAMPPVDMTPMVDLGFLLLTFFVLTSSFSKPQAMEINMPLTGEGNSQWPADRTITILLSNQNRVYWYQGVSDPNHPPVLNKTDMSGKGIRNVLLEKNHEANKMVQNLDKKYYSGLVEDIIYKKHKNQILKKHGCLVIIKATNDAAYKNVVDIVDEMQITNIGSYAIVDIKDYEKGWIAGMKDLNIQNQPL